MSTRCSRFADGLAAHLGRETLLGDAVLILAAIFALLLAEGFADLEVIVLADQLPVFSAGFARLDHHVGFVVDDALKRGDGHVEDVADLGRDGPEVPDVDDGHGQM